MNVKFACADFTFPLLPHNKSLDLIAMLEFQGVDIGLFHERSHIEPEKAFSDIKGNARKLRNELDSRKLQPADVFLQTALDFESTAINNPKESIRSFARDMFVKTLEFAKELGSTHVTILPGVHFAQESLDDSIERSSEELKWRVDKAGEYGITMAVEAHLGSFAEDPKTAARLVEMTPGLSLTLDYTHFTKLGIPDSEIEILMPYASHFHARGAREDQAQTTLTKNTIDYERVVKKMAETDYNGWVGIEYVWIDWENMNEVDNVSESIRLRDLIERTAKGL
jgi:sugar phosphate isomerase/epimerase